MTQPPLFGDRGDVSLKGTAKPRSADTGLLADMLPGGGEMGALIRARDWSATPLGAPEQWPQSLRTSLSIMLESKFAMVVAWGPDHRFFYNDRYRPVLGTKHPTSLGTPGAEIFPEVWDIVGPEFDRVLRGEAFAVEDWLLPLDRYGYLENCWFTLSYSPIRDETAGVGGVLAVVAETTGRVQSERRLATLRELARTTNARKREEVCEQAARILAGNTWDVPFSLAYLLEDDGQRARLVASSEVESGTDAAPREIDLSREDPRTGWPLQSAIASREALVLENVASRFGRLPGGFDGESAHSAVILPLVRSGATIAYGALVLGVSPRRALDERYRQFMELAAEHVTAGLAAASAYEEERRRAEELAELNRAKTAFFSNVSHEFRTPLTLLLGPVNELLTSPNLSAANRRNVELIERNSLRMLKLVNTLLDFSRIEAGRMQPRFAPVDLARATAEVASAFRATVERAGLDLRVECDALPQPVYVDRSMWEKIVLNLLSNAFKHTFAGSITVRVREESGRVQVSVRDTGIGIPPEHVEHVFERFHQVPAARSRTHEGSGIGLSLVRELARLHGGDVSVTSEVDAGSEFTVTLPFGYGHLRGDQVTSASEARRTDDAIASPYVKEAERWTGGEVAPADIVPLAGSAALAGARLLVVDDNADMRDYLARLLASAGADVRLATDGRDALRQLAAADRLPDLVLSDVMMPEMDGFALLGAMRGDEKLKSVPFMVLSARAGEESRVEGLAAGADDYVVKPFLAQEVIARVQGQVRLSRAREAERVARADAERARRQMAAVFEQAPLPICVIEGEELRYTTANAHYRETIGGRDPVGKTLLELWPELRDSEIHRIMSGVVATGHAHSAAEFPVRFDQFGQGKPREAYFNFVYHPLLTPEGATYGLIAIATDVTAHVLARREAEKLRAAAESANEAKLHLLRTVSHETRQPVHASLGYVDLLLLGLQGDVASDQRRFLENIRRNQMHLLRLLNDILSFAKLEAGVLELDIEHVDAAAVLASLEPLVRPQFAAKQVDYSIVPSYEPAEFTGDRERTIQVCINLLTNALKATPSGGRVSITSRVRDTHVEFVVSDTGTGIPADKLEEIFAPFATLARRPQPESGGVGLGLSISRQLARAMGGDITVESTVGRGSTFTLSLARAG